MVALIAIFLILTVWGIFGSARIVSQVRCHPALSLSDFGWNAQSVQLATSDGVSIAGWLVRHSAPQGILLLLHGYGASKEDLFDIARAFHQRGRYHLFLIDFRGHGASGGTVISFGRKEILDVHAALEFVSHDPDLRNLAFGCYGVSMGGAIALLAAAQLPQIKAVITDSAYASLSRILARSQRLTYHVPRVPLGQMAIWGTQWRLGCSMRDLSPVYHIRRMAPRPVLIVHGSADRGVPVAEAKVLFEAAGHPKQLWVVEGAEHVASFYRNPEVYTDRVVEFFQDAFSRET